MARMPRSSTVAPCAAAWSTSSPSKQSTSTFEYAPTTSRSISIRSSTEKSGRFASFRRMETISRSNIREPRWIRSRCPLVMGSKEPGYRAVTLVGFCGNAMILPHMSRRFLAVLLAAAPLAAWVQGPAGAMADTSADARAGLPEGTLLLARIKRHVAEEMARLPDYTCLETAERYVKAPAERVLRALDTLRLEVLDSGDKELYARPGARGFQRDHPGSFTDTGLTGTGMFSLYLRNLLVYGNGICRYRGEEQLNGRPAARYDFRVPLLGSGMTISLESASAVVASKGAFWVDPGSLDLLRLAVEADEIPPGLPLASSTWTIDYARMRLPQAAEINLRETNGREARNVIDFTHCQEFHAESAIRFEDTAPATALPPSEVPAELLPAGLSVAIALAAPVSSTDPVGAEIEGRIAGNVLLKGRTVLGEGAIVRGRIRRFEPASGAAARSMLVLEFTEIEAAGALLRFFEDLESVDAPASVERGRELPGVGAISMPGTRFTLPRGFRMLWRTRALTAPQP